MGKKIKTGKARKDKFYQLAKETGYRSRAAFKLLQLNRKYEFLQKSRVCLDLCAAPGGWLQVAVQHMPVSSLVIGIDLVPIRPISGVITLQEDITTAKCRQLVSKELKTWKADVVLNDGAPNVGQNWIHDAFQQAQLTLQALRLATDFLRSGGWFVTKVFRSKDYHALLWVFKQLFHKVHATKPAASRSESAEIFVVCQGYLAPDKLDPKFTDPKHVFKEVDATAQGSLDLIHPEKVNKKAHGYADGDYTLHHKVNVSTFLAAENHLQLLSDCHELVFDDDIIANHKLSTNEIKECCKDIKVLGKKELRNLLTWRKNMCKFLESRKQQEAIKNADVEMKDSQEADTDAPSEEDDEEEEKKLDNQLSELKEAEMKDLKRKRKKVMKEKRKLRDKMGLNMIIPGDEIELTDDISLFNLKKIKNNKQLSRLETDKTPAIESDDDDDADLDEMDAETRKRIAAYDHYANRETAADNVYSSDEDDTQKTETNDNDDDQTADDTNPLLVHFDSAEERSKRKTDMWFNKDIFSGMDDDVDKNVELRKAKETYQKKGGIVEDGNDGEETNDEDENDADSSETSSSEDSDDEVDDNSDATPQISQALSTKKHTGEGKQPKAGFEVVPINQPVKKAVKLSPVELALGEELIKSSKKKRELIEFSFNRFTRNDDNLPDWFVDDEKRYCKTRMPVTKDQIAHYKEQQKLIDARPIKKIAEATARKKKKALKKLEKVRKKAETINEEEDVTDREKWKQIKDVYKRAGLLKKKKENVTYLVAKKGVGKRVSRPKGVKGRFKVVDPRMKKDNMQKKSDNAKTTKRGRKAKSRAKK